MTFLFPSSHRISPQSFVILSAPSPLIFCAARTPFATWLMCPHTSTERCPAFIVQECARIPSCLTGTSTKGYHPFLVAVQVLDTLLRWDKVTSTSRLRKRSVLNFSLINYFSSIHRGCNQTSRLAFFRRGAGRLAQNQVILSQNVELFYAFLGIYGLDWYVVILTHLVYY